MVITAVFVPKSSIFQGSSWAGCLDRAGPGRADTFEKFMGRAGPGRENLKM